MCQTLCDQGLSAADGARASGIERNGVWIKDEEWEDVQRIESSL